MKQKLTSRKFWLMTAAFLGSLGTNIAGLVQGDTKLAIIGGVCAVLSSAIYAAAEAAVDRKRG